MVFKLYILAIIYIIKACKVGIGINIARDTSQYFVGVVIELSAKNAYLL